MLTRSSSIKAMVKKYSKAANAASLESELLPDPAISVCRMLTMKQRNIRNATVLCTNTLR